MNSQLIEEIKNLNHPDDSYFIVDLEILSRDLNLFNNAFSGIDCIISYSYKTNYLKCIVDYLNKSKVRSELVSPFEVEISKKYFIEPSSLIYNGPVKDLKSISYVLSKGGIVHADSIDDLKLIVESAKKFEIQSQYLKIGLRLSFKDKNLNSRFGIQYSRRKFKEALNILGELNIAFPYSFHFHYPSRDLNSFKIRINKIIDFLNDIYQEHKTIPHYIDIGGGLPSNMPKSVIDSLSKKEFLPIEKYGDYLSNAIKKNQLLPNFQIILEPGTALVANCMHLVGNVKSINFKSNFSYLNTDLSRTLLGGINNSISYPVRFIPKKNNYSRKLESNINFKLAGYSCIEGDLLGDLKLNFEPAVNDKVVLSNVGSYSNVFKSPFIRTDVAVYSWDGKRLECVRRKQEVEDITELDLI